MTRKATRRTPRRPQSKSLLAALAGQGIVIPDPRDVVKYLAPHRRLAAVLPAVCEQARREFGPDAELILKVYRDPEIDDRHLTLYVRVADYQDSIIPRLDRVTEPFEEELCNNSGFLLVSTDYHPPGAAHGV